MRARGALCALLLALAAGALLKGSKEHRDMPQGAATSDAGSSGGGGGSASSCSGAAVPPATAAGLQSEGVAPQHATAANQGYGAGPAGSGRQQQQQRERSGDDAPPRWRSRPAGGGLHIVRFKRYAMAAQHRAALEAALEGSVDGSWEWVERHNPAAAYPTDFGLLRLAEPHEAALKPRLEQLAFVKDVHLERQLARVLLTADEPEQQQRQEGTLAQHAPCAAGSGGSPGSQQQQQEQGGTGAEGTDLCISKRPGRLQTRPTFSLEDNLESDGEGAAPAAGARVANDTFPASARRRRSLQQGQTLASILQADKLWGQGFKGQAVKMGVFDTGIRGDHPDVKHIEERSNWTHEPTLDDGLGHGSFVAGVIAGTDPSCPGLAPEVLLHTFRVFTNDQVSYTSWFLDAFNYAMATQMNVVNLSIGGPDYLDLPFVEKVAEITSSGIIMVSAIGNDGPLYGTLNNPADQNDVIGVGGIEYSDAIAPFSSRGMSTWEIPLGYGRSKPDVMAYGRDVQGSRIGGGCRSLSGTSVASPVVAGAVCLLASVVPEDKRWQILNPASMKQALVEGAIRLPNLNLYEQGAGKLSVVNSKFILERYIPRASLVPRTLNFTDCPYMWPFCRQPLYAGAMPLMFNATILNGQSLTGRLEGPPEWTPADEGGRLLDVQFEYSEQLWPWSGYLAVYLRVKPEGAGFSGRASGEFKFIVASPPAKGGTQQQRSIVHVPVTVDVIPTPPRAKRVLWDQFHSIRYPPAYFPRDDLQVRHDILDWHGDHPHTNFHDMFNMLRDEGYFLEVLASPATCFNASSYGSLLIVDSEDEFYPEEVAKLAADVERLGMGLLIFADWYHVDSIKKLRFFDDNTRSWWEAATGGANVPALNDLLVPFGAAYDSGALESDFVIDGLEGQGSFRMASGVPIKALPAGAWLHRTPAKHQKEGQPPKPGSPVLGLFQHGAGRVGLYGDSNCLDSSHSRSKCFKLLTHLLRWAAGEDVPALTPAAARQANPFGDFEGMPLRRPDFNFSEVSPVLQTPLRCYPNSPAEFHGASFPQWKTSVARPVRQPVAVEQVPAAGEQQQQPGNGTAASQHQGGANSTQQQQQEQQQPGQGGADAGAQQGAAAQQQPQQQPEQGAAGAGNATEAGKTAAAAKAEAEAAQKAAKAAADAEKAAADAKAAAEAEKLAAQQRGEQEEIKKQQEALQKKEVEAAHKNKEEEAQQAAKQAAQQAQQGAGAADGRDHPDITTLAQAGEGGPLHVEDHSRPKQAADKGAAVGEPFGEGAAARTSSLMHQKTAAATVAAAERDGGGSYTRSLVVEGGMLCAIAAAALWSRSRRRRVLPFRLPARGRWLLPLWGGGSEQRDRHE